MRQGLVVKALTSILWDRTIRLSRRAETPPAGLTGLSHFPTVAVERNLGQVTRLRHTTSFGGSVWPAGDDTGLAVAAT